MTCKEEHGCTVLRVCSSHIKHCSP